MADVGQELVLGAVAGLRGVLGELERLLEQTRDCMRQSDRDAQERIDRPRLAEGLSQWRDVHEPCPEFSRLWIMVIGKTHPRPLAMSEDRARIRWITVGVARGLLSP